MNNMATCCIEEGPLCTGFLLLLLVVLLLLILGTDLKIGYYYVQ